MKAALTALAATGLLVLVLFGLYAAAGSAQPPQAAPEEARAIVDSFKAPAASSAIVDPFKEHSSARPNVWLGTGAGSLDECMKMYVVPAASEEASRFAANICYRVGRGEDHALAACLLPLVKQATNRTALQVAVDLCSS